MTNQIRGIVCCLALFTIFAASDSGPNASPRIVATALDHLSVLEYDEPVIQAAIGSPSFEVERHENKVFIKPLKAGISTNLFVWTASNQHYTYELSVGDVTNMDAEIHVATAKSTQPSQDLAEKEKAMDMAVSQALTDIQPIDGSAIKNPKRQICVRFEQVLRTEKVLYIRYSIANRTRAPYQYSTPALYELKIQHAAINLSALKGKQLESRMIVKDHNPERVPINLTNSTINQETIAPGGRKEGLLAIPRTGALSDPAVFQLVLENSVQAVIVL